MNDDDMEIFNKFFVGHFPQATDDDVRLCWNGLRIFELKIARAAVERHRRELGAKVFRPDPDRMIELCRFIERPDRVFDRTEAYLRQCRAEGVKSAAEQARIKKLIDSMSDDELEEARRQVISANAFLAKKLADADPRKSPMLMNLIAMHYAARDDVREVAHAS